MAINPSFLDAVAQFVVAALESPQKIKLLLVRHNPGTHFFQSKGTYILYMPAITGHLMPKRGGNQH